MSLPIITYSRQKVFILNQIVVQKLPSWWAVHDER